MSSLIIAHHFKDEILPKGHIHQCLTVQGSSSLEPKLNVRPVSMGFVSSRMGQSDNIGRGEVEASAALELRLGMGPEREEQGAKGGCCKS